MCPLPTGANAVSGTALDVATEILYALSGRQFGLCTVTLRPCRRDCYGDSWPTMLGTPYEAALDGTYPTPTLYAGEWYNITCGSCTSGCSCARVSEVALPGPVYDITRVKVDGAVLLLGTDYRLDDWRLLVRLGGNEWPLCNDLNLADTEVGTWSVTYRLGQPVPELGKLAAGELVDEISKAMLCNSDCKLPRYVQSLARQGVNFTFPDPAQLTQLGLMGLYWVDTFVNTTNPNRLRQRSKVYDIDRPQRSRQLGTG